LSFDGAYKGNPGVTRASEVIFVLGGNVKLVYSWNIGHTTNNQVEAYAIYQGLQFARQHGIDSITLLGDSKMIINHVRMSYLPSYNRLREILH
jgi:ribonuclease HI